MPTRLIRDHLGRSEIVGDGEFAGVVDGSGVGLFDKDLDVGTYLSDPPSRRPDGRFVTTVFRLRQPRFIGSQYWQKETEVDGSTADEAKKKALDFIAGKHWQYQSANANNSISFHMNG